MGDNPPKLIETFDIKLVSFRRLIKPFNKHPPLNNSSLATNIRLVPPRRTPEGVKSKVYWASTAPEPEHSEPDVALGPKIVLKSADPEASKLIIGVISFDIPNAELPETVTPPLTFKSYVARLIAFPLAIIPFLPTILKVHKALEEPEAFTNPVGKIFTTVLNTTEPEQTNPPEDRSVKSARPLIFTPPIEKILFCLLTSADVDDTDNPPKETKTIDTPNSPPTLDPPPISAP